jgi:hypothetical protein
MLKAYAYDFVSLTHILQLYLGAFADCMVRNDAFKRTPGKEHFRAEHNFNLDVVFSQIDEAMDKATELSFELGLRSAHAHLLRFKEQRAYVKKDDLEFFTRYIREILQRIEDDLNGVQFLFVSAGKVDFYDKPIFGVAVEERFDKAIDDIREAGNCFALRRWTGVVHHCMGIIQEGLGVLAKHLGITIDIFVDDWNGIITKIENGVAAKKSAALGTKSAKQKSAWKRMEPSYNEVISDARAVKDAWRNPTAHFRRQYDEAQAKKVLGKVRDFMQNLADKLPSR